MPRIAFVNGRYVPHSEASIHIEDRGFQFSDGVYEVVACIHGRLADERGHLDRLERSLRELSIDMPVSRTSLQFIMRETLRRNRLKNASIYIQVTRGMAKRDFPFPEDCASSLVITTRAFDFDNNQKIKTGAAAITVPDIRWKRRDIKSVGLLAQVLAKQEAVENGAYEAWLVDDDDGFVTEGSSSNAWIVTRDGKIVTRHATREILRGVTRTALEKICAGMQMKIEERAFTPQEAYDAAEAFNTGAVALIVPIVKIDDRTIGTGKPGPITQKLYEEYRAYADGLRGDTVGWKADLVKETEK